MRKSAWPRRNKEAADLGFRSGFELDTFRNLLARGVAVEYEDREISFVPVKPSKYHPDFTLPNCILVETKGRFVTKDRTKHLAIKKQYPNLDIRFVFSDPHEKLAKKSKTTYAMWCDKHGFKWAARVVPQEWVDEPKTPERTLALEECTTITEAKKRGKLTDE